MHFHKVIHALIVHNEGVDEKQGLYLLYTVDQLIQDTAETVVCLLVLTDFVAGMDNGGMIPAAKELANLGQGGFRHIPAEVHGNLTGIGDIAGALLGMKVFNLDFEIGGHDFLDDIHGDFLGLAVGENVLEGFRHQVGVYRPLGQGGVCYHPGKGAF